jgi:hypothetical protein
MHYFKDAANQVYAYTYAASARPGQIAISEADALVLAAGPAVAPDFVAQERVWRDCELSALLWLRERHRDQLEIGFDTTLTAEQFTELLVCMQALRDWPQSPDFPDSLHRPIVPEWIAEQAET